VMNFLEGVVCISSLAVSRRSDCSRVGRANTVCIARVEPMFAERNGVTVRPYADRLFGGTNRVRAVNQKRFETCGVNLSLLPAGEAILPVRCMGWIKKVA
jgi:hypothetical protein